MDFTTQTAIANCPQYYPEPTPIRMPTIKQRIETAVKQAEDRLAAIKEAEEIFKRNPDIERLLDIMQRGNF